MIRNAKPEAVAVKVQEPLSGDWNISAENLKHSKPSAHIAEWIVNVPAEGSATLEYTARVNW